MGRTFAVIVTFNGESWIRGALTSLQESTEPCEVIVVDNASSDATAQIIREEYPWVQLLTPGQNRGFGTGNNIGISRAIAQGADYIFLLNQDAHVTADALTKLSGFLDANRDFDLATPLHCSPDLSRVDPRTQRNYLNNFAAEYLSDACLGQIKSHYPIRGINAAAWMVRASAFRKVGGFDPLFFMYGEDDDLINRFDFHRCKFAIVPAARVVHLRQSPPSPPVSWRKAVVKRAERVRAGILVELKLPGHSVRHMLSIILSKGLVRPMADYIVNHDHQRLLAHLVASARLLRELPQIRNSSRQCVKEGTHFLELQ